MKTKIFLAKNTLGARPYVRMKKISDY